MRSTRTGEAEARVRMAALAARYPGALRELDDMELAEITRRVAALDSALRAQGQVERWMEAIALFHALARGALCAKRWLVGRKRVDVAVQRAYQDAVSGLAFPEDARAWASDLALIASPPRGRMTDAVFARVAVGLGTSERQARRLVFGALRRRK